MLQSMGSQRVRLDLVTKQTIKECKGTYIIVPVLSLRGVTSVLCSLRWGGILLGHLGLLLAFHARLSWPADLCRPQDFLSLTWSLETKVEAGGDSGLQPVPLGLCGKPDVEW